MTRVHTEKGPLYTSWGNTECDGRSSVSLGVRVPRMMARKKLRTLIEWGMIRPEVPSEPAGVRNVPEKPRSLPDHAHRGVIVVREIKRKKITLNAR